MKEIVAIIRPDKYLSTLEAVMKLGATDCLEQRVLGRGRQGGLRYLRPGSNPVQETIDFLPKRMLTWLIPEEKTAALVAAVMRANGTSAYGDGKIFVCPVEGVYGNIE